MSELKGLRARVKVHQEAIAALIEGISPMTASMDRHNDAFVEPGLPTRFRERIRKHQLLITALVEEILSLTAPDSEKDTPTVEVDLSKYFRDSPEFLSEMIAPFKQTGKPEEVKGT